MVRAGAGRVAGLRRAGRGRRRDGRGRRDGGPALRDPVAGQPERRLGSGQQRRDAARGAAAGLARACVVGVLDWLRDETEATVVELFATGEGSGLYEELGFTPTAWPAMRMRLRP